MKSLVVYMWNVNKPQSLGIPVSFCTIRCQNRAQGWLFGISLILWQTLFPSDTSFEIASTRFDEHENNIGIYRTKV